LLVEAAPSCQNWYWVLRITPRITPEKAILKAGLQPWPRLWQNFRATRATELADSHPSHVAAAWLGHTERIADDHYRQVTDEHYQRAVTEATGRLPAHPTNDLAQNPAQSPHFSAHQRSPQETENPAKTEVCGVLMSSENHPSGGQGTRTLNRQAGT
jgi:hypothetical protein